jgi:hypothetical protein
MKRRDTNSLKFISLKSQVKDKKQPETRNETQGGFMATFQNFEDIGAWQKSRELTREIYRVSKQGSFSKDFGLRDQIRRASTSIMSNIAEGFERSGTGEFAQFLAISKGSPAK